MQQVTFREYLELQAQVEAAEQLDEALGFPVQKLVDGIKAAIKLRSEKKAAELMAKLSAEAAKRRDLRKMQQGARDTKSSVGALPPDIEDALSPEDKKFLAKVARTTPTGTQGTIGTR